MSDETTGLTAAGIEALVTGDVRAKLADLRARATALGALRIMTDAEYEESSAMAGDLQRFRKLIADRHRLLKAPLLKASKAVDAAKAACEDELTAAQQAHAPGHTAETARRIEQVRQLQAERDLAERRQREAERVEREARVSQLRASELLRAVSADDPLGLNIVNDAEPTLAEPLPAPEPLPEVPKAPATAYATRRTWHVVIDSDEAIPYEVEGADGVVYRLLIVDPKAVKAALDAGCSVPGARLEMREAMTSTGRG